MSTYLSKRFMLKYFLNYKDDDIELAELMLHNESKKPNIERIARMLSRRSCPETKEYLEEVSTRIGEEDEQENIRRRSRTHS